MMIADHFLQCILCRRRHLETRELRSDPAGEDKMDQLAMISLYLCWRAAGSATLIRNVTFCPNIKEFSHCVKVVGH